MIAVETYELTRTEENGVFEPLPAQAVFSHVAKCCQPPPRIIVVSYVCSKVTQWVKEKHKIA